MSSDRYNESFPYIVIGALLAVVLGAHLIAGVVGFLFGSVILIMLEDFGEYCRYGGYEKVLRGS